MTADPDTKIENIEGKSPTEKIQHIIHHHNKTQDEWFKIRADFNATIEEMSRKIDEADIKGLSNKVEELSTKIDEYNKEVNGKIIEHSAQIDSLSDKIEIQKIYSNENRKRIDDLRGDHKDLVKTVADNYMNIDKKLELNRTERRDDIKNVRDDLAKGFDSLRKEQDVIIQKKDEKKDAKWNKGIKLAGVLITLISTVFLIISGLIAWGVIK